MSRRRQLAVREREAAESLKYEPVQDREAKSPAPPPQKTEGVFRMSMVLWGFPLLFFITVTVLKSQCGL